MKLPTQILHGTRREAADSKGEVQGTPHARVRGARAVTEHVGLRPKIPANPETGWLLLYFLRASGGPTVCEGLVHASTEAGV